MSYFICVSAYQGADALPRRFGEAFEVVPADDLPIGKTLTGNRLQDSSALILSGRCSTNLLDRGPKKDRLAAAFLLSLEAVVDECVYVSFLLHFARGDLRNEAVQSMGKVKTTLAEFQEVFPEQVLEDTRYFVAGDPPWG